MDGEQDRFHIITLLAYAALFRVTSIPRNTPDRPLHWSFPLKIFTSKQVFLFLACLLLWRIGGANFSGYGVSNAYTDSLSLS